MKKAKVLLFVMVLSLALSTLAFATENNTIVTNNPIKDNNSVKMECIIDAEITNT